MQRALRDLRSLLLALTIKHFQRVCQLLRFSHIRRYQQLIRIKRCVEPACGIQPRPKLKRNCAGIHGADAAPRSRQQRRNARARLLVNTLQAAPYQGAVLAREWRQIRHRAERHQVQQRVTLRRTCSQWQSLLQRLHKFVRKPNTG